MFESFVAFYVPFGSVPAVQNSTTSMAAIRGILLKNSVFEADEKTLAPQARLRFLNTEGIPTAVENSV